MLKIRRPLGRLIFNMGIAIPGKTVFLIETAPRLFSSSVSVTKLPKSQYRPFSEAIEDRGLFWIWARPMREAVTKYASSYWLSPYPEWSPRIYLCSLSHKICTQFKCVRFVMVKSHHKFAVDSFDSFTHILQGCFTGIEAIYMITQCSSQWSGSVLEGCGWTRSVVDRNKMQERANLEHIQSQFIVAFWYLLSAVL